MKILKTVLNEQLKGFKNIVIAYEPVWAIGSGKAIDPNKLKDVIGFIRENFSKNKILYGGSVNKKNIESLYSSINIDGFLVGGASLKLDSLLSILHKLR